MRVTATDRAPDSEHLGLVTAGYVMAVLLPIGGLIAGLVLDRRRPGHALGIIFLSVGVMAAYMFGAIMILTS